MRALAIALLLSSLAGAAAAAEPRPTAGARDTFAGCRWQEVKGATYSVWSFACGPKFSSLHLEADDKLPGFRLVSKTDTGFDRQTAIRIFHKDAGAPLTSILPAVRAASPGKHTAQCGLVPGPSARGRAFLLEPTGAAKRAYDKANAGDQVPDNPCGDLGVGPVGDRSFEPVKGDPTAVAFIDYGSEIQPFDAATLRRLPGK